MTTVCVFANTLSYPEGGGHRWVYLNWALGLRALGCDVIWMEGVSPRTSIARAKSNVDVLRSQLAPFGLADQLALCSLGRTPLDPGLASLGRPYESTLTADALLNLSYSAPARIVRAFKRSALIDIDPGLLQVWMATRTIRVAPHSVYFTIGETVGQPTARFPDAGVSWHYTPPCVATEWWPVHPGQPDAPFTTVSNWYTAEEWMEDADGVYANDKRDGFVPYLDLPRHTRQPLELALCLSPDQDDERALLSEKGWRLADATVVASSPARYQDYIQRSRGEFSCVKPSCIRLENAWISDRTLCYLASGKPAVIQHTGPSRFLPDDAGLLRFNTLAEAARCLELVAADYDRQSRLARQLAEEYFDARTVAGRVLETVLA